MKNLLIKTPVAMKILKSVFVLAIILSLFSSCSRGVGCPYASSIDQIESAADIAKTDEASKPLDADEYCKP